MNTLTVFKHVLCIAWMLIASTAYAWGSLGHQVIATLAQQQLSPKSQQEISKLLSAEPGATLVTISTWADEQRNPATAAWHYVNFPRGQCVYEPQRDCPDGRCVVEAIQSQAKILSSKADDEKRLQALKYLVHLVGDVHQPLHAGYADDRGGNSYQLQAFMRGSNLHAFWDTGLIKNLNESVDTLAVRLSSLPASKQDASGTVVDAAEESCAIVGQPGFYPDRLVGTEYIDRFTPLMEKRLTLAGGRLARLLNDLLK